MRFEEALDQARGLCVVLDDLSSDYSCDRNIRGRAAADKLAVEVLMGWAMRAFREEERRLREVDGLNLVHGV